jgi:fermentation-respiration switch protein FrsA (DUF1100 family)
LTFRELQPRTDDGERLHAWLTAPPSERLGTILFAHGNAGNIGDRVFEAALLARAGFDVLMFDYRGYGHSTGKPDEHGTYLDARAALKELLAQPEVDPQRVIYLGESLGGAVALELAIHQPPAGLILQSTFTSVRAIARHHYTVIPRAAIPDAYPSLSRISRLTAPLLVLHGDRDEIVPLEHGRALYAAAPDPKQIHVFEGCGHNDLVQLAELDYARTIADWARGL